MRRAWPLRFAGPCALGLALLAGCNGGGGGPGDAGADAATDSDSDTDTDIDTDSDTETDSESETDSDTCPEACVRRVDHAAAEGGDGLSWETAFARVQDGLDAAFAVAEACGACQVWVTQGTYYIFEELSADTVRLRQGVAIYGGFAGDETALDQRDPDPALTVLSGLDGPSGSSHVRHVVTGASDALIDGFTITEGAAGAGDDDDPHWAGGGVLIAGVQGMVLGNCALTANHGNSGGAIAVVDAGASIVDCALADNGTDEGAGAILIDHGDVEIVGCDLEGHSAASGLGGAIRAFESILFVRRCAFAGNLAAFGGAMHADNSLVAITSSVFSGNSADEGGAIDAEGSQLRITGSTFHGNTAFDASILRAEYCGVGISSSIFWANPLSTPGNVVESLYSEVTIDYCVFAGGAAGEGNLNANPLFADGDGGDYHLLAGSPAIDAADGSALSTLDKDQNPRVDDPDTPDTGVGDPPYADMGAFEHQP